MAYAGPYADGDDTGPYSSSGDPYSDFERSYASPGGARGPQARYTESDYLEELEGGADMGGKFFESLTYTCGTGYLAGLLSLSLSLSLSLALCLLDLRAPLSLSLNL